MSQKKDRADESLKKTTEELYGVTLKNVAPTPDEILRPTFTLPEEEGPPPHAPEIATAEERVGGAFLVIAEHLANGGQFSFSQMDLGIELSLSVLPKPDQKWFREIARTHHLPLWQCLWAQWRRNQENGLANALVLDPGWRSGRVMELTKVQCEWCQVWFQPERWGQKFCSNLHGADAERKATGLPPREEAPVASEPQPKEVQGQPVGGENSDAGVGI